MKTAAIIVTYKDSADLKNLLSQIKDYSSLDSIIVVDNGASDPSTKLDSSAIPASDKITIRASPKNGGYGFGNNVGLRYAYDHGITHALIANPDTSFENDIFTALVNAISTSNDVAVASCICNTPESPYEAPESAWPLRSWSLELFERGPIMRRILKSKLHYPDSFSKAPGISEVGAVHGSLLAVDVQKLQQLGGYDEKIFLYCEENILGSKLKEQGYKTLLLKDYSYTHNHKPAQPSIESLENLICSELYYFENYLRVSKFKLLLSKFYFGIVKLELRIYSVLKKDM